MIDMTHPTTTTRCLGVYGSIKPTPPGGIADGVAAGGKEGWRASEPKMLLNRFDTRLSEPTTPWKRDVLYKPIKVGTGSDKDRQEQIEHQHVWLHCFVQLTTTWELCNVDMYIIKKNDIYIYVIMCGIRKINHSETTCSARLMWNCWFRHLPRNSFQVHRWSTQRHLHRCRNSKRAVEDINKNMLDMNDIEYTFNSLTVKTYHIQFL